MPKNILIFSDGTGQVGGIRPDQRLSNVYKLYRATRIGPDSSINPREQVAFYDAGLGTDDDAGNSLLAFVRFIRKLLSSATGRGITRNITDCYEAIINLYEPGDRIYLFGFSRGAYTARCVAGVISLCGIPTLGKDKTPIPKYRAETRSIADEAVRKAYEHGAGRNRNKFEAERSEQARRFRLKYGSDENGAPNVIPYFIGVFDTVASLGAKGIRRIFMSFFLVLTVIVSSLLFAQFMHTFLGTNSWYVSGIILAAILVWFIASSIQSSLKWIKDYPEKGDFHWHIAKWEMANYDRRLAPQVPFARHAISIDESRADFPRVAWGARENVGKSPEGIERFIQLWFAGNHSDIGGSYPEEESRLSDITLQWMIDEATSLPHPIIVEGTKLHLFPSAAGMQHCEIEAFKEKIPRWVPERLRVSWRKETRKIDKDAPLHPTVRERFKLKSVMQHGADSPYRPESLQNHSELAPFYKEVLTE